MSCCAGSSQRVPPPVSETRLPFEAVPLRYDVMLVPSLVNCTFQGHVFTVLNVKQTVNSLTCNSAELEYPTQDGTTASPPQAYCFQLSNQHPLYKQFHHASSTSSSCSESKDVFKPTPLTTDSVANYLPDDVQAYNKAKSVVLDTHLERATFAFEKPLQAGLWVFSVRFNGILNDKLCGFYRSKIWIEGRQENIGVTQFEATDARRAIPCWDEPSLKAIFGVTIICPKPLVALSNMPVARKSITTNSANEEPEVSRGLDYPEYWQRYEFFDSPIMSTYLLAWIVGDLDYISGFTSTGLEVKIYTPPGKSHLGHFALDVAIKALEYYNDYFQINYPLPKLDLVAIPDFAAGAMENWGLVTYRETCLLIDPAKSSQAIMTRVARTVSHETAHSWFGNLVTMGWWDNLWLNEGFARFLEHMAVDHIFPEWNIWTQFVSEVYQTALGLDALESSHPVEVPVYHAKEVNEIFDSISYAKGGSIIRMLYFHIGAEAFRKGLQHYTHKYAYKNTVTENLWESFSIASGQDVSKLMDGWVKKIGFPVLQISNGSTNTGKGAHSTSLHIKQERFLSSNSSAEAIKKHENEIWNIPLKIAHVNEANGSIVSTHSLIFSAKEDANVPTGNTTNSLVKLNPGSTAFYRCSYAADVLHDLITVLPKLSPEDRLSLSKDVFAMSTSGRNDISQALDILKAFSREENYYVVSALYNNLTQLIALHAEQPYIALLKRLIHQTFEGTWNKLKWGPSSASSSSSVKEDHQTVLLRACVASIMNLTGDEVFIKEALHKLDLYIQDSTKNDIPADLRAVVYSVAAKYGGWDYINKLMTLYRSSTLQEEQNRILLVVGNAQPNTHVKAEDAKQIILMLLNVGLTDEVRSNALPALLSGIGSHALGRELAWSWFTRNWDNFFLPRYGTGQNFLISAVLTALLSGYKEEEHAKRFEDFFKQHPLASVERTLSQLSETIRSKDARLKREKASLEKYLKANFH